MPGPTLPGMPVPGQTQSAPTTPGKNESDPQPAGNEVLRAAEVPVDATGVTALGDADGFRGEVVNVVVDPTAADFDFNIEADGSDLFSAEQSPGAASREEFTPDQNASFGGLAPALEVDVSGASATGGATARVEVVVAVDEA